MSSFSAFNDSGCTTTVELCFLCQKTYFLYLQVPGVDIVMDYYYWMVQHPTDQYTHQNVQEIRSFILVLFVLSHPRVFSVQYFVKLPLFRNSYPGSHGTHPSPVPTTVRAIALIARKQMSRIMFPSLAFPCVELVSILQLTSIARRKHAARRFLRSVCMLMLLLQA